MSDLKHAAALALRLQTITSLVGLNGDEDQVNNTDRAVVLRFCAILDALERAAESHTYIRKVILQAPQWSSELDKVLATQDGVHRLDPYTQLALVLDGKDDMRTFLNQLKQCKELRDRDVDGPGSLQEYEKYRERLDNCAQSHASQAVELSEVQRYTAAFLQRYGDYVDQLSRIFLSLDETIGRLERQILRGMQD